jgi:hypothetical protein
MHLSIFWEYELAYGISYLDLCGESPYNAALKEMKATIYVWSAGNIVFERKATMAWQEEGNDEVTGRNSRGRGTSDKSRSFKRLRGMKENQFGGSWRCGQRRTPAGKEEEPLG